MKNKKSIFVLFVFIILIIFTFSHVNNINILGSKETQNNWNSYETEQQDLIIAKPVTLTWFSDVKFWDPPIDWSTDENTVQGLITKKTGCMFKMNIPPQDGDIKLSLMLVNDNLPDVMSITNLHMRDQLIKSGKVWKIQEFLERYDPGSHLLTDFPEDCKKAIEYLEGDWYSYPSHINTADARKLYPPSCEYYEDIQEVASTFAIMFNGDLMYEVGLTLEDFQTEDDIMTALEIIKNLEMKVNGEAIIPLLIDGSKYTGSILDDPSLKYLGNTFGAMPVDENGNYRDILLAPEMKHALKFLNTLVLQGYMDPNQLTYSNSMIKEYIASGRVFCFIGNTANCGFSLNSMESWVSPGAILSSEGKTPVLDIEQQASSGWMQTFISKDCKYPEIVAKWLSFMTSKEGMLLAMYGFEGIDYNWNEEGLLIQTDTGLENTKNYSITGISAYWPFQNATFGKSVLPAPTSKIDTMVQAVHCAYGKDLETSIYDSSLLYIPSNLIDENSELGVANANIIKFRESQLVKIILSMDDKTFNELYDELISTMKKYGIDKIDAVRNTAVQANYERYGMRLESINGD